MKKRNIFKLIVSILVCQAAGAIGGLATASSVGGWYQALAKPSWTPSGEVIGTVWTILYLLMGFALYLVWEKEEEAEESVQGKIGTAWERLLQKISFDPWRKRGAISIFAAQLVLNVFWSVIFFGLKSPGLAFFELLVLWAAIAWTVASFWRVSKPAAYLLLPYIAWVTFAGYLNFVLWQMN